MIEALSDVSSEDPRELAFATLCALSHKGGGEELYGQSWSRGIWAYRKSLVGSSYPSFWLEAPLAGKVGFDLHVYYKRGQVLPGERFADGCGFGMQDLFDWYFATETGGVGVGFAHDLRVDPIATGAYVNFVKSPLDDPRGFFGSLGTPEAFEWVRGVLERIPRGWHPWYLGLFPGRAHTPVRVGSFVSRDRQEAFVQDPQTFVNDLRRVGFDALDGEMLDRIVAMASLPFKLELQLDVTEAGTADTLGVDLTLALKSSSSVCASFAADGDGARACELLEGWGIADGRWRSIAPASLSHLVPFKEGSMLMTCIPSFLKAKWCGTRPQDAKVYFNCNTRPL